MKPKMLGPRQRAMLRDMFRGGPFEALLNLVEGIPGKSGEIQLSLLEQVDREIKLSLSPKGKDLVARLVR